MIALSNRLEAAREANIASALEAAASQEALIRQGRESLDQPLSSSLRELARAEVGEVRVTLTGPSSSGSISSQALEGVEAGLGQLAAALAQSTATEEEAEIFGMPNLSTVASQQFAPSGADGILDTSSGVPRAEMYFLDLENSEANPQESEVIARLQDELAAENRLVAA